MNATPESWERPRAALLAWYGASQRDLPWRLDSHIPYRVLVAEVLAQQTQAARAAMFYERFLRAFPSAESLAVAPLEAVYAAWQGAGYYARARNLQAAAQAIVTHGAPTTAAGWRELPGVGSYTAAAVASIALGEPVAAVDGNVRRVLSRLAGRTLAEPDLKRVAAEALEVTRPGDWNQALMDLGATICKPRRPDCAGCPVSVWCAARAAGIQAEVPASRPRRSTNLRAVAVIAGPGDGRFVLVQRPPTGLLGGLSGPPLVECPLDWTAHDLARAALRLTGSLELGGPLEPLGPVTHVFTHRRLTVEAFAVFAPQGWSPPVAGPQGCRLVDPNVTAISRLDEKLLALVGWTRSVRVEQ